jgi:hypothetical protein
MEEGKMDDLEASVRYVFDCLKDVSTDTVRISDLSSLIRLVSFESMTGLHLDSDVLIQEIGALLEINSSSALHYDQFRASLLRLVSGPALRGREAEVIRTMIPPALMVIKRLVKVHSSLQQPTRSELEWVIEQINSGGIYSAHGLIDILSKTQAISENSALLSEFSQLTRLRQNSFDETSSSTSSRRTSVLNPIPMLRSYSVVIVDDYDSLDYNAFKLYSDLGDMTPVLEATAYRIFDFWSTVYILEINADAFASFVRQVGDGYLPNPYHNALHAADVLQYSHLFLLKGLKERASLEPLHIAAFLIAGLVHDFRHPGLTNGFLEKTQHDIAVRYNDISILENYHISETFALIKDMALLAHLKPEEYRTFRTLMIQCVLGTDMVKHQQHLVEAQNKLSQQDLSQERSLVLPIFTHAADIGNLSRPYDVSKQWSQRVLLEFFDQGDKERDLGLPVSFLCDRHTVSMEKSQIGFISGIVLPYFSAIFASFPEFEEIVANLNTNRSTWAKALEEREAA